jgi:hypothetical protein
MTPPADGFTVSGSDLRAAAKTIVDQWPSNFAPSFVQAGSRYLSDAEIFFALATALSDWGHDHKLPETVKISSVFGPLSFTDDAGPGAGQVRLSDLAQECARLVSTMRNTGSSAVPQNVVPERVTIGGLNLNAAQVLYAMASAVSSLPATIPIRTAHMSTPIGEDYPLIVPLGKLRAVPRSEMGAVWTIKAAPLDVKSATH